MNADNQKPEDVWREMEHFAIEQFREATEEYHENKDGGSSSVGIAQKARDRALKAITAAAAARQARECDKGMFSKQGVPSFKPKTKTIQIK